MSTQEHDNAQLAIDEVVAVLKMSDDIREGEAPHDAVARLIHERDVAVANEREWRLMLEANERAFHSAKDTAYLNGLLRACDIADEVSAERVATAQDPRVHHSMQSVAQHEVRGTKAVYDALRAEAMGEVERSIGDES